MIGHRVRTPARLALTGCEMLGAPAQGPKVLAQATLFALPSLLAPHACAQRTFAGAGVVCPRYLACAGAGVVAPGVVTVAGAGVVAPGSLRPPPKHVSLAGAGPVAPGAVPGTHQRVAGVGVTLLRGRYAWPRDVSVPSARALRMAPEEDPCAGATHGPGDGGQLCVSAIIGGASAMLALHKTPHCPTAQAVSQTHAPASRSGRPPCAQTALHQGWARRGLGGLRTAHSYTQRTTQPHPDTQPADIQPEIHRPPGSQADQDTGSLGPDWETSPCGCDVPL